MSPRPIDALAPQQEVLYRLPDVVAITGRRRSSLYRDIAAGECPAPVRLGRQSVAWKKSAIDSWIASRPIAIVPRARPMPQQQRPRTRRSRA